MQFTSGTGSKLSETESVKVTLAPVEVVASIVISLGTLIVGTVSSRIGVDGALSRIDNAKAEGTAIKKGQHISEEPSVNLHPR